MAGGAVEQDSSMSKRSELPLAIIIHTNAGFLIISRMVINVPHVPMPSQPCPYIC